MENRPGHGDVIGLRELRSDHVHAVTSLVKRHPMKKPTPDGTAKGHSRVLEIYRRRQPTATRTSDIIGWAGFGRR